MSELQRIAGPKFRRSYRVYASIGCWLWQKRIDRHGYGHMILYQETKKPRYFLAHRLAWMIEHDVILSPDILVGHICNNKHCVNPNHLYTKTWESHKPSSPRQGKDKCKRGHDWKTNKRRNGKAGFTCRTCTKERLKLRYKTNKEKN